MGLKHGLAFTILFVKSICAISQPICPDPGQVKALCMMVNTHMKNPDASSDKYMYQVRMKKAACVSATDSTKTAQQKLHDFLAMHTLPTCNNLQFDVLDGNILKFAVSAKFDDFLIDMIDWGADLNTVDVSDGRTVLDYVAYHAEKNSGNDLKKRFDRYYSTLRAAGAKHRREIE